MEECRRKWKNLRDTYHQYRLRKPKVGESLSKWRYAKEMEFLSNVYQPKLKALRGQHFMNNHNHNNSFNLSTVNNGIGNNIDIHHQILKKIGNGDDEDEDDMEDTDDLDRQNHDHDHCQINVSAQDIVNGDIITVNESDAFILTAYDEVSHDNDVSNEGHSLVGSGELRHHHESSNLEICMDIVKDEQHNSLDNENSHHDGEVDYEEVCLYEETGNPSGVDCDSIIASAPNLNNGHHHNHQHQHSGEPKFEYISTGDFCIGTLNPVVTRCTQFSNVTNTSAMCTSTTSTIKLRALSPICNNSTDPISITPNAIDASTPTITLPDNNVITTLNSTPSEITLTSSTVHIHPINDLPPVSCITNTISPVMTPMASTSSSASSSNCSTNKPILETSNNVLQMPQASIITFPPSPATTICTNGVPGAGAVAMPPNSVYYGQQRDECDLFFDFLKKKIQSFPPREITAMQVEFLNCILRREAAYAQRQQNSTNSNDLGTLSMTPDT